MSLQIKIAAILLLFYTLLSSQQLNREYFLKNGEVYFSFNINDKNDLENLSKLISIDNFSNGTVYAYANESEFNKFLRLNLNYEILPHPGDVKNIEMSSNLDMISNWNVYPTYEAYVNMMYQYQLSYPELCRVESAGVTVEGREILFAVISDNVNQRETEPQFMYSSTMHGDETTGYVLMLRLIDSLLTSYNSDVRITSLINNIEIWINPNANPDGTYRSGNNSVSGARRYNSNGVDINRNFPDPDDGSHPDGNAWQPETIAMMDLADAHHFSLSANFHGGEEVVNYPWDTWSSLHADDNWFKYISHQYADTAHAFSPSYYMNGFDNGITNGYQWYTISGGRQDYFTYYHGCRELTIEISSTKLPPASLLPAYWDYNKRSLINLIEQCANGISGIVTNTFGNTIRAKVKVLNHDFNNSEVYSDSITGSYYRFIEPGNYTIVFEADSHITKTIENVQTVNGLNTQLNIVLEPDFIIPVELMSFNASPDADKIVLRWKTATETNNYGFEIERKVLNNTNNEFTRLDFVDGAGTSSTINEYVYTDYLINISSGEISYRLKQIDFDGNAVYSNELLVTNLRPKNFILFQNYPNPFNPNTKIEYQIASNGDGENANVSLTIYDILGNKVSTLVNEQKTAGKYEAEFDAVGLTSGIYFYKLSVSYPDDKLINGFSKIRKMLLLK